MGKADTKTKTQAEAPQEAPAAQLPATIQLRLPYPKSAQEAFGISQSEWIVLTDVIFPNATSTAAILLALRYCKARNLDIMKRVVNVVPMYSKVLGRMVDTIWPGIAEVRITATRTGDYAGRDAEEFGPMVMFKYRAGKDQDGHPVYGSIEVPEWCRLTVYKIVRGQRCAFVGPTIYWEEAYATAGRDTEKPNDMWEGRKRGQVSKCAEAGSIRAAFPEETGGMLTAEEMHGRMIEGDINPETMVVQDDVIIPPRPKQSDFAPKAETAKQPDVKPGDTVQVGGKTMTVVGPGAMPAQDDIPDDLRRDKVDIGQKQPEPEPVNDAPSEAFNRAWGALDQVEKNIIDVKDLDQLKKEGRANIDSEPDLTEGERDELRARFTTLVLTEQRRRAQKGKK